MFFILSFANLFLKFVLLDDPMLEKESNTMVTGCVVGILQRNLRDFVVSIAEFSSSFTGGKVCFSFTLDILAFWVEKVLKNGKCLKIF